MFGGLFGSLGGGFFNQNYRAYPVAFIDKSGAEKGDKVILPPSALQTLGALYICIQCCAGVVCLRAPAARAGPTTSRTSHEACIQLA